MGIVGLWTLLILSKRVPEIQDRDRAIWFHVAAEYVLSAALIAAGLLVLFVGDGTPIRVFAGTALGGVVYSTINSAGYYARS